ncbi:hypothetical protein EON64_18875, partial [archaeon]
MKFQYPPSSPAVSISPPRYIFLLLQAKVDTPDSNEPSLLTSKASLRKALKPPDDSHIVYAADKVSSIPREVFLDFLQTAVKMLLDTDNQREMVLESCAQEIGLD